MSDGKYHYYLQDHQGNNCVVIDQNGAVEEMNQYDPFGALMSSTSGSNSVQPYKYNGKELDRKGGLEWYDYGARMYDATLGRWHAMDPSAENYDFSSPYGYCLNNPMNYIDPLGADTVSVQNVNWDEFKPNNDVISLPEVTVNGSMNVADASMSFGFGGNAAFGFAANTTQEDSNMSHWEQMYKLRGPAMVATTTPIVPKNSKLAKTIWPESRRVLGSSKNTSIASLVLRRHIRSAPIKGLPKALSLGGQLGRLAGKIFAPLGIALTIYDDYTMAESFMNGPTNVYFEKLRENVTTIGMYNE